MQNSKPDGFHYLLEFFGCDVAQINDMSFWQKELKASIEGSSMESLHDFFYQFDPEGITGYLLLSSSHISIHTWPENQYLACDVFTCATEKETEKAVQYLKDHITHERVETKKIQRGFKVTRTSGKVQDAAQCTLDRHCMTVPILSTGDAMMINVVQVIVEIETALQKIQIVDTVEYGKCLLIDGRMETAQSDHYLHDRELVKKLRSTDKDVLILGGGDGNVAQRVISENPGAHINVDVVDLDVEVVKACERYLGQDVFSNDNVDLKIADALHYLKTTKKTYDGIIVDLTHIPIGRTEEDQFVQFFKDLCVLSYERTADDGWITIRAGATEVTTSYIDAVSIITPLLKMAKWRNIENSDVVIPSYGESCAFLFARK
jgi:spermidine synthase